MKSNISKQTSTLVLLGAVFLLCTSLITFSTPINAIESQFINGLPINQPQPLTIINTEKIDLNGNDYILITYSDLSIKIMPLVEYNHHSYETEIHVNVEDNNNEHHNKQHDHKHEWTQEDFNRKYPGLPDDGTLSDDDNGVTHHTAEETITSAHMIRPPHPQQQQDNTDTQSTDNTESSNSDETTDSDSGATSTDDNGSSSDSSSDSSNDSDSGSDSSSNDSSSDSGSGGGDNGGSSDSGSDSGSD